jgi:DNA polymerase III delta prime subunit
MLDSSKYDPLSPKRIDEIVGNSETWKSTQTLISNNASSHIVLVGPAGCGKSIFLRLALAGFPTLVIDCTANFGLRDVRDTIRIFARGGRTGDGRLRWVVFEHADSLTADTQAFLRRMLETTAATTRFVFECKDAGAISEPIVSRSMILTVNAPEATEMAYELQRRTQFRVDRPVIDTIVKHSYGNMRSALLNALAKAHCGTHEAQGPDTTTIQALLRDRPTSGDWVPWAVKTEQTCRYYGIDLRDILRTGWPTHPSVANTCATWSRLGGTSPRTLFFDCIASLRLSS